MDAAPAGRFPLVGEPLALDLINTRLRGADLLATPEQLRAWLAAQAERLPQPDAPLSAADLEAVRALRAAVTAAVQHARRGRRPPEPLLQALTDAQRAAPEYRVLSWDGSAVRATPCRPGGYAARLVAELAAAAAELLASPEVTTVRPCEAPGCVVLYLPTHPRRRWCSPVCGNRVRVARHAARRRRP